MRTPRRVAVLQDYAEEGWPSMDIVGEQIVTQVPLVSGGDWLAQGIKPAFRHRFSTPGGLQGVGFTSDRLLNRFWDYPHHARALVGQYEVFHLADHSYSQLLHELPAHRTLVSLHDLDTFTCLLSPCDEPRSLPFRRMAGRIWSGLLQAGRIVCDSNIVQAQLLAVVPQLAARSTVIHNGVDAAFFAVTDAATHAAVRCRLGPKDGGVVEILHVGSCIPRKRIDLLLKIFAAVRATGLQARLLRVGAPMTEAQRVQAEALGVLQHITEHCNVPLAELVAIYGRADVVLLTPDREGFGLPMIEALATGTPVVARDIAILREVGGACPRYFLGEDVRAARDQVLSAVRLDVGPTQKNTRIERAKQFSWELAAEAWVNQYETLLALQAND